MSSLFKGLAEVDGIVSGCEYLDLYDQYSPTRRHIAPTSPSSDYSDHHHSATPAYQRPETPDLGSFFRSRCAALSSPKQALSGFMSPGCSPSPPGQNHSRPSPSQWAALQTLREGVNIIHAQFEKLTPDDPSHMLVVDRLRDAYGDSKGMRETGLLTYKDILQGMSPGDLRLEEIFAFSCLSYSLAKYLYAKGKLNEDRILHGLPVWREAVSVDERPAFDFLARNLWPESRRILDLVTGIPGIPLESPLAAIKPDDPLSLDATFLSGHSQMLSPASEIGIASMIPMDAQQPIAPLGSSAWDFSPFPTFSNNALDLMLESSNEFGFSDFQTAALPASSYSPEADFMESPCPSLVPSVESSQSPPPIDFTMATQTPPPLGERLRNTEMFRVFALWCSHLYELQKLLWTLSGDGLFSQKTGKRGGFTASRQLRKFQDSMLELFFAPLADVLPASMADILKLTKSRVLDGVLSTLRDVELHLLAVSEAFILNSETRRWFLEIILNRCVKVSRNMSTCVYNTKTETEYSEGYVQSKLDTALGDSISRVGSPPSPASSSSPSLSSPSSLKRSASQESEGVDEPEVSSQPAKKSARVACHICGKSYSGHSNLSRHKRHAHQKGAALQFACQFPSCKKKCSRADNLKQHVELVHLKHIEATAAPAMAN